MRKSIFGAALFAATLAFASAAHAYQEPAPTSNVKADGTGFITVASVSNSLNTTASRNTYNANVSTTPVAFSMTKVESYTLNCGGQSRLVQSVTVTPWAHTLQSAIPPINSCDPGTPQGYKIVRGTPGSTTNPMPAVGSACNMSNGTPATVVSVTPGNSSPGTDNSAYAPIYTFKVSIYNQSLRLSVPIETPQP